MVFQRMDDMFDVRRVKSDTTARRVDLLSPDGGTAGHLQYDVAQPSVLTLSGNLDEQAVDMRLERINHTQFTLLQRGFRWVQDRPCNR